MKGIQIVGILVSLYLLAQTFLNYRRGNFGSKRALFFFALWGLVAFLFVYPSSVEFVLPILTTQDMIVSVLIVGLVITFVLISELYQQMGRIKKRITELVQNLAIHEYVKEACNLREEDE